MRRRETGRPGGAGPSQRQLRVGEELRHALVEILREGHARDPALRDANVTVTEVRVSPDLTNATAYVMTLGGVHADETVTALNHAAAYFRAQLAHAVQLRHAPRLSFALDTSFLHGARIADLLNDPAVKRDLPQDRDV